MSFLMQAPYPNVQTASLLPSPQFANTESRKVKLKSVMRSMDGTRRTYVQTTPDEELSFHFILTRFKALEVRAFIQSYFASKIKITDHNGDVWVVRMVNDPFEFTSDDAAAPVREHCSITLTMRGTKQT